jgi:hypothetical protein
LLDIFVLSLVVVVLLGSVILEAWIWLSPDACSTVEPQSFRPRDSFT